MAVLGHAPPAGNLDDGRHMAKLFQGRLDLVRLQVHLRIAVAFLIAARRKAVECQWIGIGCGLRLLDQDAEHAALDSTDGLPLGDGTWGGG